jgi:mutator protein MutT
MSPKIVDIAIGLVWKEGRLLIARRPPGVHLAGLWEFPGGKIEAGETPAACVQRELREEVGIEAEVTGTRAVIVFAYPERTVRLHPLDCRWLSGDPRPAGSEEPRWVAPAGLSAYEFPAANAPLLAELIRRGTEPPGLTPDRRTDDGPDRPGPE